MRAKFNEAQQAEGGAKKAISMADMIVLAGCAAVEAAAKAGAADANSGSGDSAEVAFFAGRGDATDEMTDANSFAVLEPKADGFRNYPLKPSAADQDSSMSPEGKEGLESNLDNCLRYRPVIDYSLAP